MLNTVIVALQALQFISISFNLCQFKSVMYWLFVGFESETLLDTKCLKQTFHIC